jgi:hypothetical protein
VEEYDHGGLPAFRVRDKRFASMLDRDSVNLMPGEEAIRAAVAEWLQWCREERFGKRLSAVRVEFASMDPAIVEEVVSDAWCRRRRRSWSIHATRGQTGSTAASPATRVSTAVASSSWTPAVDFRVAARGRRLRLAHAADAE